MQIGVMVNTMDRSGLAGAIAQVRTAAAEGVESAWFTQIYGVDALTAIAVAGREVPGITLGTAVLPTYPRHPLVLAGQALTVQAATGGRLVLGLGLSHQLAMEGMMGIPYDRPALHMREYLTVLRSLVAGETVDFRGETLRAATLLGPVQVADADPFPILVAALAPAMLRVAGELADGTLRGMAGPDVVGKRIGPSIAAAAEAAGRPAPRVGVGLPVCVTADVAAARERAARQLAMYGTLPAYRRLLDEEGVDGPADVLIAGDEDHVAERIRGLADRGATGFIGSPLGSAPEREATVRLLGALARETP